MYMMREIYQAGRGKAPEVVAALKTLDKIFEQAGYTNRRIYVDYDGDKNVDCEVSLLDYKTEQNPHPDVCELINPYDQKWKGMADVFAKMAERNFDDGLIIYRAAWKKGLTNKEIDDYAFASSTGEKYECGYWMREKVFRCSGSIAVSSCLRNSAYAMMQVSGVLSSWLTV